MAKKTAVVDENVPEAPVDRYAHIKDKKVKNLLTKIEKTPRVKADFEKLLNNARTYAEKQQTPDPQLKALIEQLERFMSPRNQHFMDYTHPFELELENAN